MSYTTLLHSVADGVATVTLNRPERLNAMNAALLKELRQAVRQAADDTAIRCVLITGAGRGFCAGADLAAGDELMVDGRPDPGPAMERLYNPLVRALRALEKPVVAAVNGPCAGGGMGLAMACDIVIAARSATFLQAFCHLGLIPDVGSTWFLPRLVGSARAAGLAMLGDKLPAETAAEWGLIWKCVDDAALMDEATALARKLAAGPTRGLGLIKRALLQSASNNLDAQLDVERDLQRLAARSDDFIEGVSAFLQKRPAKFQGR